MAQQVNKATMKKRLNAEQVEQLARLGVNDCNTIADLIELFPVRRFHFGRLILPTRLRISTIPDSEDWVASYGDKKNIAKEMIDVLYGLFIELTKHKKYKNGLFDKEHTKAIQGTGCVLHPTAIG